MLYFYSKKNYPQIHKTAYIHPTAVIIGNVRVGRNVFVGPGAVIRADENNSSITIKDNCNVQDRVIVHALGNSSVVVHNSSSLSHGCIIHGPCIIGKKCFIGFGSVVFNAELSDEIIVKHLAVIEGVKIPSGKIVPNKTVLDSKEKVKTLPPLTKELRAFAQQVIKVNLQLTTGYKDE